MGKKRREPEQATAVTEPITIQQTVYENDPRSNLEEIKKYEGVIGYILRNATSAAIDLKDPTKIVEYALISSASFEAGKDLAETFDLGEINGTLVEGKNMKMLSIMINENKISIFMDKNADADRVYRRILPT